MWALLWAVLVGAFFVDLKGAYSVAFYVAYCWAFLSERLFRRLFGVV